MAAEQRRKVFTSRFKVGVSQPRTFTAVGAPRSSPQPSPGRQEAAHVLDLTPQATAPARRGPLEHESFPLAAGAADHPVGSWTDPDGTFTWSEPYDSVSSSAGGGSLAGRLQDELNRLDNQIDSESMVAEADAGDFDDLGACLAEQLTLLAAVKGDPHVMVHVSHERIAAICEAAEEAMQAVAAAAESIGVSRRALIASVQPQGDETRAAAHARDTGAAEQRLERLRRARRQAPSPLHIAGPDESAALGPATSSSR